MMTGCHSGAELFVIINGPHLGLIEFDGSPSTSSTSHPFLTGRRAGPTALSWPKFRSGVAFYDQFRKSSRTRYRFAGATGVALIKRSTSAVTLPRPSTATAFTSSISMYPRMSSQT